MPCQYAAHVGPKRPAKATRAQLALEATTPRRAQHTRIFGAFPTTGTACSARPNTSSNIGPQRSAVRTSAVPGPQTVQQRTPIVPHVPHDTTGRSNHSSTGATRSATLGLMMVTVTTLHARALLSANLCVACRSAASALPRGCCARLSFQVCVHVHVGVVVCGVCIAAAAACRVEPWFRRASCRCPLRRLRCSRRCRARPRPRVIGIHHVEACDCVGLESPRACAGEASSWRASEYVSLCECCQRSLSSSVQWDGGARLVTSSVVCVQQGATEAQLRRCGVRPGVLHLS
jgi:hypothetical protein